METRPLRRGDFLRLAWRALLALVTTMGLGGLWRFLSYQPAGSPRRSYDLGPKDAFPSGERRVVAEARAVIWRQPHGVLALSALCPHLGCQVALTGEGFICPCHGSRFDEGGVYRSGPAKSDLAHLRLEETDDGHLILSMD